MPDIQHVSDTALWIAAYRALESERSDALFNDRLAGRLSGERGFQIAREMPFSTFAQWAMVIRTVAIDQLILQALEEGVDTVINIGAGLDTRPYRMNLPAGLNWIELDFAKLLAYKNAALAREEPVCRLTRIPLDLSDPYERRSILKQLALQADSALVITEGVIYYLSNQEAIMLSDDILNSPAIKFWIQDFRNDPLSQIGMDELQEALKDAPFRFDVSDWLDFFRNLGWQANEVIYTSDYAQEIKRPFPMSANTELSLLMAPEETREQWKRSAGYVMLSR